ncbi:DgyrCDS13055 [Dimorphilus gyrociliatus]|uniref:DgyrCDS13055 n=1 Tax=Dimorphilus gyrociliatus TaxID=2664684 RepID=A0A7I8W9L2_9ANNE|nr:DgyrCDS13055 [Dimorphilus gyrociliatus]
MPVQVTQQRNGSSFTHKIDIRGMAGGMLLVSLLACVFNVIGFATSGWSVRKLSSGSYHIGLWEQCVCGSNQDYGGSASKSWFKATQAMTTIGLIFLILALLASVFYVFVHIFNKNVCLTAGIVSAALGCLFCLIGLIIFGVKEKNHNWSFAFVCISAILSLFGTILMVILFRKARD